MFVLFFLDVYIAQKNRKIKHSLRPYQRGIPEKKQNWARLGRLSVQKNGPCIPKNSYLILLFS